MNRRYPDMQSRLIRWSVVAEWLDPFQGSLCWQWIGRVNVNRSYTPYGTLTERVRGKVVRRYAHRVAFIAFTGQRLTKQHVVMHLCNNPLCINPAHLKRGTQKANVQQCVREGRHISGFTRRAP